MDCGASYRVEKIVRVGGVSGFIRRGIAHLSFARSGNIIISDTPLSMIFIRGQSHGLLEWTYSLLPQAVTDNRARTINCQMFHINKKLVPSLYYQNVNERQ